MRLPYTPADPQFSSPSDRAILDTIKTRRNGTLIPLDRALLHAPPVANGWNSFLKAIRTETSLSASVREVAICRVAVLNRAWFEWEAHVPILREAGQVGDEGIEYLKSRPANGGGAAAAAAGEKDGAGGLDEQHLAVLDYTDAMTVGVVVPKPVFTRLENLFSEREVIEITATVAAYNCVSRFLVALDVGEMADKYGVDME